MEVKKKGARMQRSGAGEASPHLEKRKHLEAERRLKRALLEGRRDYPGKQADIELCARKRKELGDQRLRQVIAAVGGGGCD